MNLEHVFTMTVELDQAIDAGAVPLGTRMALMTKSGTFAGEKLSGKVLPGGGDWLLVDSAGMGRVDVRAMLETDDGAKIYVQYFGVLEMNEKVGAAIATGGEIQFGDTYFVTAPRLECGDPKYAWVNQTVFVGQGRLIAGGVEYRVFAVRND